MKIFQWYRSYLTNWILTIYILYIYNILPKFMKYTVFLSLKFLLIGGPYITYINPKRIYIPSLKIELKGFSLQCLDFLFHVLPFFMFKFQNRHEIQKSSMLPFYMLLLIYLCCNDPIQLYGVSKKEIIILIGIHLLISI